MEVLFLPFILLIFLHLRILLSFITSSVFKGVVKSSQMENQPVGLLIRILWKSLTLFQGAYCRFSKCFWGCRQAPPCPSIVTGRDEWPDGLSGALWQASWQEYSASPARRRAGYQSTKTCGRPLICSVSGWIKKCFTRPIRLCGWDIAKLQSTQEQRYRRTRVTYEGDSK